MQYFLRSFRVCIRINYNVSESVGKHHCPHGSTMAYSMQCFSPLSKAWDRIQLLLACAPLLLFTLSRQQTAESALTELPRAHTHTHTHTHTQHTHTHTHTHTRTHTGLGLKRNDKLATRLSLSSWKRSGTGDHTSVDQGMVGTGDHLHTMVWVACYKRSYLGAPWDGRYKPPYFGAPCDGR